MFYERESYTDLGSQRRVIGIIVDLGADNEFHLIRLSEDLDDAFAGVSKFLYPGGIFIFDCNTSYKYRESIGESTIAEAGEDVSFIWENYYDEEENVNEYDLTLFIKREDGLYERAEETHLQRGIEVSDIERLADKCGLEIVLMVDSDTEEEVREETERIYAVLRKKS